MWMRRFNGSFSDSWKTLFPACQVRFQVWCFMVTVFSFWAVSSCALETWWWEMNGSRLENCLSFACLMCFCVSFLQVEGHHKAIFSMAYVVTPRVCVWKGAFSSVLYKVGCCQKLRCVGGCEDGADPGRLTPVSVRACWPSCPSCLRLVLSRRQPVLWFECDFRMEDWLYVSCKCSFTISSSRAGGSAHSVWCFKTLWFSDGVFMIQLVSVCSRAPTGTIMAQNTWHHLCFPGSAHSCFWSAPSQQNCFNLASGGNSVLPQVLCESMILCHKPKHCLEGEILENIKTLTTTCGFVVLLWL